MSAVSDMTRKYWTDTMLAWAERRLAPPQMDECQRAIDEMHAECSEVRELRAALELEKARSSEWDKYAESLRLEAHRLKNQLALQASALERARALAETWAAMKYNGDLTAAVYHGCADELAAALSSGGEARP